MKEEEEGKDDDIEVFKVVLVGESGVGKTSIIDRYVNDQFSEELKATSIATYAGKKLTFKDSRNNEVLFEIWDTAGQEKYRAQSKMFYRDASIIILVYDITNDTSFEELKNFWIKDVKENASEDVILGIAGNKSDLIEAQKVDEKTARSWAEEIDVTFFSTSAAENNGISDLFYSLGEKLLQLGKKGEKKKKKIVLDEKKSEPKKKKCC